MRRSAAKGVPPAAFGANGTLKPCENVVECVTPSNLTDQVSVETSWGKMPALKSIANHCEKFYVEYARRILSGEEPSHEIMVPQGFPTVEGRVMDSEVWWDVLETACGWKLEKNKVTGHCRIIDAAKKRHAWGLEVRMRDAFEKVKRQLR